jgi:hypothetical protein
VKRRHLCLSTACAGVIGLGTWGALAQPQEASKPQTISEGRVTGLNLQPDWPIEAKSKKLIYNNPYGQNLAPRWCDGEIVFRVSFGEVKVDPKAVKAAKEYLAVYKAPKPGEPWDAVERVPDQLPIYDTKPGDEGYNPIWHYHWYVVPRDYKPNTLKSEDDIKKGGYPIVPVEHYTN